jgi:tellurite resistance-related uncharacterized protein
LFVLTVRAHQSIPCQNKKLRPTFLLDHQTQYPGSVSSLSLMQGRIQGYTQRAASQAF